MKKRIVVLYGGRSGEHEVALRSAASVVRELDRTRFEILPIAVAKDGTWYRMPDTLADAGLSSLPVDSQAPLVMLPPAPRKGRPALWVWDASGRKEEEFDALFPVMHGSMGEDGTLQGLLELAEVPYVGCGVLASSVGMDKEVAKRLARDAGLPVVPFVAVRASDWAQVSDRAAVRERVEKELGFPVFVKPSNAGSSLGVHKVKQAAALEAAITDSLRYDAKVLVERGIPAREIEMSALESLVDGAPPEISIAGEIIPTHEFYSYEAKYVDENGARLLIPAELTPAQMKDLQNLARDVFQALECEGLARVDLFVDRQNGAIYLNEINTLPGFTSISMYPKLWAASGLGYRELLTRLVDLAFARALRKGKLLREFEPQKS